MTYVFFDARKCFDEKMVKQKLGYMHQNPVQGKLNLVEDYVDYRHSSTRFYATGFHGVYEVTHYKEIMAGVKKGESKVAQDPLRETLGRLKRCVKTGNSNSDYLFIPGIQYIDGFSTYIEEFRTSKGRPLR